MKRLFIFLRNLIFASFVIATSSTVRQSQLAMASDYHSPRTAALGGAGHASPVLTDAIYLNPSFTSFMNTHALSLGYLTYCCGTVPHPGEGELYGHNLSLSVLDGTPDSLFQAGVGYTRREDARFIHVGASKSFLERFGAGLGSKFIFPDNGTSSRIIDGTLSLSGVLTNWFQTALIVDNLFETDPGKGFYREFILGTKFNIDKIFLVYLDPHWVPSLPASSGQSQFGIEAGAEFPFLSQIFLRTGIFRSAGIPYQAQYSTRGNGWSVGLGWIAPKLSLDYAYSRVTDPLFTQSHNFAMTIYF